MAKKLDDKKKKKIKIDADEGRAISEEIFNKTQQAFEKAGFTADKIAEELALIAFSDMADYVVIDDGGAMQAIPFDEMKKGKSRVVKKIREKTQITENRDGSEIYKTSQIEYELHGKLKALDEGICIMGFKAPEKVELKIDIASELEAARQRVKSRR
ncbi:MAG: terminase small subunit [Candidatus Neomarinimicrobiota bacterium]|jgi:hypothetical protein